MFSPNSTAITCKISITANHSVTRNQNGNFNDPGETYFQFKNFMTAFFWGIGLLAHGLTVFVPNWIMGQNWEERKIKEFMEKEKNNQNQWN